MPKNHKPGLSGNPSRRARQQATGPGGLPEMVDMSKLSPEERKEAAREAFYMNMAQMPVMLAQMLGGLRQDVINVGTEVAGVRMQLVPPLEKFHVAAVFPLDYNAPDHRFRVYCLACSEQAGRFVYPCAIGNDPEVQVGPMPSTDVLQIPPSLRGGGPLIKWQKDIDAANSAAQDQLELREEVQDDESSDHPADADEQPAADGPERVRLPEGEPEEALSAAGDDDQA